MIDVHYASLTSQGVQHRVFYLDGHPSRYQPRPTGLNFGEQTGTGVFLLAIAVPNHIIVFWRRRCSNSPLAPVPRASGLIIMIVIIMMV